MVMIQHASVQSRETWVQILILAFMSCVNSGKSLHLTEPQFFHLFNGITTLKGEHEYIASLTVMYKMLAKSNVPFLRDEETEARVK